MPWADSVFSPTAVDDLPPHRPYDCAIEIEEGKSPPFGPMYRLSQDEHKALGEYLDTSLKKGFICCSTSSASSPILFVRKKTGDLCLCVDYRGLNAITKKNRYPLPHIDDLLDRTQGCKFFTVINLKNAFNLIRIREGDEWKTAFWTPLGLYEYLVMPFGLSNAPSFFQAFIQDTLRDFLGVFCVVYLDDILIFSRTQEEHDEQVKRVLDRLKNAHLYANPQKCEFDKSEVEYLGYIIGADSIKMNPKKLVTISEWPVPQSSTLPSLNLIPILLNFTLMLPQNLSYLLMTPLYLFIPFSTAEKSVTITNISFTGLMPLLLMILGFHFLIYLPLLMSSLSAFIVAILVLLVLILLLYILQYLTLYLLTKTLFYLHRSPVLPHHFLFLHLWNIQTVMYQMYPPPLIPCLSLPHLNHGL
ncbi:hypothetical protein H1R20_g1331, partial [Candolleomyces eurysporus]